MNYNIAALQILWWKVVFNYQDEEVKFDEGISCPNAAISKTSQGEKERHVFNTLGLNNLSLQIS